MNRIWTCSHEGVMIRARVGIALSVLSALGVLPAGGHKAARVQRNGDVAPVIKDTARVVAPLTDPSVIALFQPNETLAPSWIGNVKKLKALPPSCRAGVNANAFVGGFRLWEKAEGRRQLVQLGHAVRPWPLEAYHHHHITLELACLERRQDLILIGEDPGGRLDRPAGRVDRAGLEGRAAEIALHEPHASIWIEGIGHRPQHGFVERSGRCGLPHQPFALQLRLARIVAEIIASDRHDVAMEQAGVEQGRDGERHSTRGFELAYSPGFRHGAG